MSIKVTNSSDLTISSLIDSESASASDSLTSSVSFDETLENATRAINAMTVDATLKTLKENGQTGIALNSKLAYELGITESYSNMTASATASSSSASAATAAALTSTAAASSGNFDATGHYTTLCPSHAGTSGYDNSGLLECSEDLQTIFEQAAEATGVDVKLIKSICFAESSFRTDLVCSNGATGAMMLMPVAMQEYGVTNGTDPYQNIMAGAQILADKLNEFNGDVTLAAAAYNAGSNAVHKYGGVPPYEETQNYVKKINEFYNS